MLIFKNYSGSVTLVRALSRRLPCCMAKPQALEGERVAFAGGGNIRLRAGGHVAGGFLLLILSLYLLGGPPDCSAAVVASAADHLPRLGRLGELRQRSLRQQLDPVRGRGSSLQNRRYALGPAPQRLYKPSRESAARASVPPPPPNSLFVVGTIFVVGCIWACAKNMLVLFGCCSRNRAAALASVVRYESEENIPAAPATPAANASPASKVTLDSWDFAVHFRHFLKAYYDSMCEILRNVQLTNRHRHALRYHEG